MAKYDLAFQPYHLTQNGLVLSPAGVLDPAGYVSPAHEAMANKTPWWQATYPVAMKGSYLQKSYRTAILSLPVGPQQTWVGAAYE